MKTLAYLTCRFHITNACTCGCYSGYSSGISGTCYKGIKVIIIHMYKQNHVPVLPLSQPCDDVNNEGDAGNRLPAKL